MAKFLTITQKGFNFTAHDADKMIADEEWSIERVAAFISVHHVLNIMATRYAKGMTYKPGVAAIQYTLKADPPSSADINKITKFLVPKLCGLYDDPETQKFLGRPLSTVLDDVTHMVDDHIAGLEAPVQVFGKEVIPPPFFTRPSRLEYDAELERATAQEQRYWDHFKEVLNSGRAAGHTILVREGTNTYTAIITKVSPKCVFCDIKDEYGRLIQSGARIPRNSTRLIIESFR